MSSAGWFPDPARRAELRYFDGQRWTAHVSTSGQSWAETGGLNPSRPAHPAGASPHAPVFVSVAPSPSNGLAVAALVVGIVGAVFGLIPLFFFISLPLGVLALIFGLVGIRKASKGGRRMGMAIAGTVLGLVSAGLGVIGFVIVDEAVEDLGEVFGPASAEDYSASIQTCGRDRFDFADATGTITNDSNERMTFWVTVYFVDDDGIRLADATDLVSDLAPGETARWSAGGLTKVPANVRCRLSVE